MYNPQLETFIKVADAGSFSKAATESYITTTAVIKQINLLEANLDVQLFIRTHRGLILTEAGQSLYQDAKYMIQYAKDSVLRAKRAIPKKDHTVRIGTSPMTPGEFLVKLWPEIHHYCPEIKFQLIPYENTPENAKEILKNLGRDIDLVAGIFAPNFLENRGCSALELSKEPICCAVSIHNPLAMKDKLNITDLYGNSLMLIQRGWNCYVDSLRDDLLQNHPEIQIVDFPFYNVEVFNQCGNSDNLLMTIPSWAGVHPLLKMIPVQWDYKIPFGILHSANPSEPVKHLLSAIQRVMEE